MPNYKYHQLNLSSKIVGQKILKSFPGWMFYVKAGNAIHMPCVKVTAWFYISPKSLKGWFGTVTIKEELYLKNPQRYHIKAVKQMIKHYKKSL